MASNKKVPEKYVCTLSPDLLKKAKTELNEDPERREQDIQELRERVGKYPGLNARTDAKFLIRFLRARKFNIDRAFEMLLKFYQMRQENPDIFTNFQPSSVKPVLEDDIFNVLADRDKHGCRIMSFRIGRWDIQKYNIIEVFRAEIMTLTKLIQDEETQVNGIIYLMDLEGFTLSHAYHFTPSLAKKISSILQESFPMRFKGIHVVNEPTIFKYILTIMSPFLKQKTLDRIRLHASDYPALHRFFSQDILPEEYDGKKPPLSSKEWRNLLCSCEDEFIADQKYGLEKIVAEYNPNEQDAMDTLVGSFRKLEP